MRNRYATHHPGQKVKNRNGDVGFSNASVRACDPPDLCNCGGNVYAARISLHGAPTDRKSPVDGR